MTQLATQGGSATPPTHRRAGGRPGRLLTAALGSGVAVLAVMLLTVQVTHHDVGTFTRDITTLCAEAGSRLPPYAGAVGLLNFMVWASAATLSLLVAVLVPARRRWLTGFAALLLVLLADDSLSFHEEIGPSLGVPEVTTYVVYVAVAGGLAWSALQRWRRTGEIASADVAFVLGGALLATSILVDQLTHRQHLAEDGPKLLGAFVWLTVPLLSLPAGLVSRIQALSDELGGVAD